MRRNRLARNILLGIENLLLHKLRSLLTTLGVVFGVGSVVAMLSVGEGASKEALERIRKLGSNNVIISSIKSAEEEATSTTHSHMSIYGLTYADYSRLVETFGSVRQAVPVKLIRKDSYLGEKTVELRVVGTTAAWFELVRRQVLAGRVLLDEDEQKQTPVAVLTEHGARKLLATEHTIGQAIRIGGDYFEVIGILRSEAGGIVAGKSSHPGDIQMPDEENDAYIPIEVARQYFGDINARQTAGGRERERVELHQVIVQIDDESNVEPTAAGIEKMLSMFHKKRDYLVSVPLALRKAAEETKRMFNIVLGSIASISLLVGGIGIMNIMLASVTERTREIGIRRAIGAKRRQIIGQFLVETSVLSTVGGMIGIGMGVLVPYLITYITRMATVVTLESILLPLFISAGIGIVFGLYPAVRAANVDPIVALRHE